MSYAGRHGSRVLGRGIFAAGGLGHNPYETHGLFGLGQSPYKAHGIFSLSGLLGLGQTKPAGTTTTADRTASDWGTALTTAGSLVGGIVGAATGTPGAATTVAEPEIDPAAAIAPASPTPSWYWPVVIGVGVAVLGGIGYMSYTVKAPVKSNRRRRLRRNYAYGSTSHPSSYDSHGRPRRNGRRRRHSRR